MDVQAVVARQLWMEAGQPEGRDQEMWHQAGALLERQGQRLLLSDAYLWLIQSMVSADEKQRYFPAPSMAEMKRDPRAAATRLVHAVLNPESLPCVPPQSEQPRDVA